MRSTPGTRSTRSKNGSRLRRLRSQLRTGISKSVLRSSPRVCRMSGLFAAGRCRVRLRLARRAARSTSTCDRDVVLHVVDARNRPTDFPHVPLQPFVMHVAGERGARCFTRSEEHTSELQSHSDLVCRLLLEKKKKKE